MTVVDRVTSVPTRQPDAASIIKSARRTLEVGANLGAGEAFHFVPDALSMVSAALGQSVVESARAFSVRGWSIASLADQFTGSIDGLADAFTAPPGKQLPGRTHVIATTTWDDVLVSNALAGCGHNLTLSELQGLLVLEQEVRDILEILPRSGTPLEALVTDCRGLTHTTVRLSWSWGNWQGVSRRGGQGRRTIIFALPDQAVTH